MPLAIGNPQRTIYRRLLVEIYGNLTFGLVQRVRHGDGQGRRRGARGARADRRARGEAAARRARRRRRRAAAHRDRRARLRAEQERRARALRVRDRAGRAAAPHARDDRVRRAARPGLLAEVRGAPLPEAGAATRRCRPTRSRSPRRGASRELGRQDARSRCLRKLAQNGTPEMRAFAVLGLGALKDRTSTADVAAIARALDAGTVARAAAAYALGELGAETESADARSRSPKAPTRCRGRWRSLALARMGAAKSAEPPGGKAALAAMADAVFAGGETQSARARLAAESLQRAGTAALVLLATRSSRRTQAADCLPVPDGTLDVEAHARSARAAKLLREGARRGAREVRREPLKRAALSALQTSSERARAVLDALGARRRRVRAVLRRRRRRRRPRRAKAKAQRSAARSSRAIVPLARHPDPQMRTKAIVLLARSGSADAQTAIVGGGRRLGRAGAARRARGDRHTRGRGRGHRGREGHAKRTRTGRCASSRAQALGRLGAAGAGADATKALSDAAHDGRLRARPRGRARRARELRQGRRVTSRRDDGAEGRRASRPRDREAHRPIPLRKPH